MTSTGNEYAVLLERQIVPNSDGIVPPELSEDAIALRFSELHADDLRHTAELHRWHRWAGTRWQKDSTYKTFDLIRSVCREISGNADKAAKHIASASTVANVERLARTDQRHAMTPDSWDADNWKLNTPGGIVDLRTGKLLPHNPADYCTKITAVALSSSTPELWLRFLARVTADNKELQAFLKRMAGYSLTGDISEHALFFLWGTGKNGKSTFINVLTGILHDYARVAPPEVFTLQKYEKHPTSLAGLQGARLCTATETEKGAHLAESQVKSLTGGDKITARYMRGDYFDYTPCFKLLIGSNNKPTLRSVDEAIRRRINLLPFVVTIPESERDSTLAEKLKKEWPGILSWAIDGCLEWQRDGLNPPAIVQDATDNYLDEEDILGRWLAERTVIGKRYETSSAALFADWKLWTETNNEFTGSQRSFSMTIEGRSGITKSDSRQGRGFRGIGLKSDHREESQ